MHRRPAAPSITSLDDVKSFAAAPSGEFVLVNWSRSISSPSFLPSLLDMTEVNL